MNEELNYTPYLVDYQSQADRQTSSVLQAANEVYEDLGFKILGEVDVFDQLKQGAQVRDCILTFTIFESTRSPFIHVFYTSDVQEMDKIDQMYAMVVKKLGQTHSYWNLPDFEQVQNIDTLKEA